MGSVIELANQSREKIIRNPRLHGPATVWLGSGPFENGIRTRDGAPSLGNRWNGKWQRRAQGRSNRSLCKAR